MSRSSLASSNIPGEYFPLPLQTATRWPFFLPARPAEERRPDCFVRIFPGNILQVDHSPKTFAVSLKSLFSKAHVYLLVVASEACLIALWTASSSARKRWL